MALSRRQITFFNNLSPQDRKEIIRDLQQQLHAIDMSDSPAADAKRKDYSERIAYLQQLNDRDAR